MKINPILSTIPVKTFNLCKKQDVCFLGNIDKNEVIKTLPNGTRVVLRGINNPNSDKYSVNYFGILDKNNEIGRDVRFDKRYNEIRAIEYKKPVSGFRWVQNSLSVSFDKDNKIRNIYLINHSDNYSVHSVLNIKDGFSACVHCFKTDKNVLINEDDKKSLLDYFLYHSKGALKEIQENNLTGSENIMEKFENFLDLTL